MPPGTLFIVATPIGNLEDVTLRALRVLREVRLIAAEDTRTAKKLLDRHEIATPCAALHEHSAPARIDDLVKRLRNGDSIAVISEAGTPGISDPGRALTDAAIAAGIAVVPVPGPVAFVAALSASGLPMERVTFEGFLPSKAAERRTALAALAAEPRTMSFYEAPHRIAESLADMRDAFGADRRAVIAREMTKVHEEFERGTLGDLAAKWSTREPKGEFTVLVAGAPPAPPASQSEIEIALDDAFERGLSVSEAAREIAGMCGWGRKKVYEIALQMKKK